MRIKTCAIPVSDKDAKLKPSDFLTILRPIANPHPSVDGIAGGSGTIGNHDTALRLLSAGIAASIPADASRSEADGAVRGLFQGWISARHAPLR